jgi:hypothetical protein
MKPMNWKKLATLINEQNYSDYVKAQIYLECQEALFDFSITEEQLDAYIEYGLKVYNNSDFIQPAHIGEAIYLGLNEAHPDDYDEVEDVTVLGFQIRGEQNY